MSLSLFYSIGRTEMKTHERYKPVVVGVNSSVTISGVTLGGFLAKTAGTVTVTTNEGVVIISAHPVAAGTWNEMPFFTSPNGYTFTTAGGAGGTIAA